MSIFTSIFEERETLKGLFYELSPLVISLAILVMLQNVVVAWDNFKRREKMAPWLFTGIAVADICFAQGLLILSVISILVYREVLHDVVLYKAQFYVTALPGLTCSKLYNVMLSVTLTFNLADPFRVLNVVMIKWCIIAATVILTLLHVSDFVWTKVDLPLFKEQIQHPFFYMAIFDEVPGVLFQECCLYHMRFLSHKKRDFSMRRRRETWTFDMGSLCSLLRYSCYNDSNLHGTPDHISLPKSLGNT